MLEAGEARHLNDPANRAFLDSIARGECPSELEPANRGAEVNVNLVRSERDYVAPDKPRYKAFAGTGRVLSGACCGRLHTEMCRAGILQIHFAAFAIPALLRCRLWSRDVQCGISKAECTAAIIAQFWGSLA